MKKIFTLLAFVITIIASAQAPQGFNYQATVRNSSGALITNQNVLFKFNIMLNSQTSLPVYSETHQAPTDDLGQVSLTVGQGTPTIGSFASINWANGTYYLGIELNTGSGYVTMGTTQLLSVPYALYANTAGNTQTSNPNLSSVLTQGNNAGNLQIKNLLDPTDEKDAVTKSYLEGLVSQLQNQINQINQNIDNDNDGYSENLGDCDDSNTSISPNITEILDGIDNNCDGIVDNLPTLVDNDGDGLTEEQGDCDDNNPNVNPNATEIVNDGIDNNCDGIIEDYTSNFNKLAVPGNHQGWNPPTAPKIASSDVGLTDYEGYIWLDGGFKLIAPDTQGFFNWGNTDWGDDGTFSGVLLATGESDITASAGYYRLTADTGTLTYSLEPANWGIIGFATTGNNNGWNNSIDLTYNSSTNKWESLITLFAGEFKFRANNTWLINLGGDDDSDGFMDYGGSNLTVNTTGTYLVSLDLSNPRKYTFSMTLQ
jgi:hypothetical protein